MAFRMGSSCSKSVNKSGNKRIDGTNSNFTIGKRLCVLIVDDDPVIQRIHCVLLSRFGLETQVVGNGKEAVDLYRSGASFHLVLMDMEMPIMDGPKVSFLFLLLLFSFLLLFFFFFLANINNILLCYIRRYIKRNAYITFQIYIFILVLLTKKKGKTMVIRFTSTYIYM